MNRYIFTSSLAVVCGVASQLYAQTDSRPNIIYIMSDDHASGAISCYGNKTISDIFQTPNIDKIANEGIRLNSCFVTNSISTPSRAAILTGQYSQMNGVYTLANWLQPDHPNLAKELQNGGYQTAIVGKWHLGTEPSGFDYYNVLPGQGDYDNPRLIEKNNRTEELFHKEKGRQYIGHSTDIITDQALNWIRDRDDSAPFFLMCHFKAPHRWWVPAERFRSLFNDIDFPEPPTIYDTYQTKGDQIKDLLMRLEDLNERDLKTEIPPDLTRDEQRSWAYQLYIKDYLRCVAGVDENVGRILTFLEKNGLNENTIIIYTSDQGFFLGEHGLFDKRLMYEESLKMPFLVRYPKGIKPEGVRDEMVLNIDFAPTLLDYAGITKPEYMQGSSFRQVLEGNTPPDWREGIYYRYWMHADNDHNVPAHYGLRNDRFKLIFYYGLPLGMRGANDRATTPAWELYDLEKDPQELMNLYSDPQYKDIIVSMKEELLRLKTECNDQDSNYPEMAPIIQKYW